MEKVIQTFRRGAGYSGLTLALTIGLSACSGSSSKPESSQEISAVGPTIIHERINPAKIELNPSLQSDRPIEILAEVKDLRASVSEVRVKFRNAPLELPMTNIGGTTWRANITPRQIQQLAVSGATRHYEADIIARDSAGAISTAQTPLIIAITAPKFSEGTS